MLGQILGLGTNLVKTVGSSAIAVTGEAISLGTCLTKLTEQTITDTISELKEQFEPEKQEPLFNQLVKQVNQQKEGQSMNTNNTQETIYTIHSGGAYGSDTVFGLIAKQFNVDTKHYYYGTKSEHNAPNGNTLISEQDYEEGKIMSALSAKYNWGYPYETMKDPRLCRNWAQVKYADAIFAVTNVVNKGERVFPDQPNDTRIALNQCCTGGTGYAVSMAILVNKPVYVYALNFDTWCTYDKETKQFVKCDTPKLFPNSAGIGTRNISTKGAEAIYNLFTNTFNK